MIRILTGIVLSLQDYREHDAILTVLCEEDGVQSFVARGIRKLSSKNAGSTQVFTHASFYVDFHERKTMHGMRTADIIHSHRLLREDLQKQAIAAIFCECMERIELYDYKEAFHMLADSLSLLENTPQPYALAGLFLAIMNQTNGIEPFVDGCVHCMSLHNIVTISLQDGGFVCKDCFRKEHMVCYPKHELTCFRLLCKATLPQYKILESYGKWTYHDFIKIYNFFEEYSGIHLKSIRFLKMIQEME